MLWAGVLVDAQTSEFLSDITLEASPESEIRLPDLAVDAREFIFSVAATLTTPMAIERALQLYLEQRLTSYGFLRREVIVKVLVRK